jgi:hypothetical protein
MCTTRRSSLLNKAEAIDLVGTNAKLFSAQDRDCPTSFSIPGDVSAESIFVLQTRTASVIAYAASSDESE